VDYLGHVVSIDGIKPNAKKMLEKGLGASLIQMKDGVEQVIGYASRAVTKIEATYSVWELEALAVLWACKVYRMYLLSAHFKVVTDSKAASRHPATPRASRQWASAAMGPRTARLRLRNRASCWQTSLQRGRPQQEPVRAN